MPRDFKIRGKTAEEKFKYLDTILPRMFRRMSPNKTTKLPSSFSSCFKETVDDKAFNILLFKGKVVKVAYNIEGVKTDLAPENIFIKVRFTIVKGETESVVNVTNKKLSHVADVNVEVNDGDLIKVENVNPDVIYNGMTFGVLYIPDYSEKLVERVEALDARI